MGTVSWGTKLAFSFLLFFFFPIVSDLLRPFDRKLAFVAYKSLRVVKAGSLKSSDQRKKKKEQNPNSDELL